MKTEAPEEMKTMRTVDELVSEWTEEERENLKGLIEECREREKALIENSRVCRENLDKLTGLMGSFFTSMNEMKTSASKLGDDLWGIYLRAYNKNMPSS
jgi:hypothetical protein